MSHAPTFDDYRAQALAEGFDEVLERNWPPNAALDSHTHPFALKARMVQGAMWLSVGNETQELRPGDEFTLERDILHAERYGPEGATYWVARRN